MPAGLPRQASPAGLPRVPADARKPVAVLAHEEGDKSFRQEADRGNGEDGGGEAEPVGDPPGEQGADGMAEVAPEPIDAERSRPPCRMRGVGNGGAVPERVETTESRADGGGA